MKTRLSFIAALFVLCPAMLIAPTEAATVLYSQSLDNALQGGPYSNASQLFADSFTLQTAGAVNEVSWYGAAYNNLPFSSFDVEFFSSSNTGAPGAVIASDVVTPTIAQTGLTDNYGKAVLLFTADVPTFQALAGTQYFFSVSDAGTENFVWASSNLSSGGYVSNGGGNWNSMANGTESAQAFALSGIASAVPEPSTWAMLLVGFAGIGFAGWRKSRFTTPSETPPPSWSPLHPSSGRRSCAGRDTFSASKYRSRRHLDRSTDSGCLPRTRRASWNPARHPTATIWTPPARFATEPDIGLLEASPKLLTGFGFVCSESSAVYLTIRLAEEAPVIV